MPYPTAYRSGQRAALRASLRDFIGNESGLLRFPDLDRGTWASPIGDPVAPRPAPQLPPPPIPLSPPDPATRRQQDIPWFERSRGMSRVVRAAGWIGAAIATYDMLWPSGQNLWPFTPPGPGMLHVCGPSGWPGPPYQRSLRTFMRDASASSPQCGLGGQSFAGADVLPQPNTHTIYTVWGPNMALLPVERWSIDSQDRWPSGTPPALMTFAQVGFSMPYAAVGSVGPGVNVNAVPIPQPLWSVPQEQVTGPSQQGTTRSNTAVDIDTAVVTSARTETGGLHFEPSYPEVRPEPRTRERKTDPRVGAAFKVFSQIGSWHSFVDALWHSLPPKYSHRRRTFAQRLDDIYKHYDEIDLDRAIRYLVKFWLLYKGAGFAYGRAQQTLVKWFGPNNGMYIYRGLVQAGAL